VPQRKSSSPTGSNLPRLMGLSCLGVAAMLAGACSGPDKPSDGKAKAAAAGAAASSQSDSGAKRVTPDGKVAAGISGGSTSASTMPKGADIAPNPMAPGAGVKPATPSTGIACNVEDPDALAASKSVNVTEFEVEMMKKVNEYRVKNGVKPVESLPHIVYVSKIHSARMATGKEAFSHNAFEARIATLKSMGMTLVDWGENITQTASGAGGPENGVVRWSMSPGHNANMLKANYTHAGLGSAKDPKTGICYSTHIFVQRTN